MSKLGEIFLESAIKRLHTYRQLGEATFMQLTDEDFDYTPNAESNSLAVIIQHMSGNMLSRWTNFLTEDGEKPWRARDKEFNPQGYDRAKLMELWNQGWDCLMNTLKSLKPEDLEKTIKIRHEPLIVVDAINRQLAHYPHHVGQIVYIGKMLRGRDWKSLSIARGQSDAFNEQMKRSH